MLPLRYYDINVIILFIIILIILISSVIFVYNGSMTVEQII